MDEKTTRGPIDEKPATEGGVPGEEAEDTEGHTFLHDHYAAGQLAKARSVDLDRTVSERQRAKEARPNRNR